ncbi:asparagine synthase (glutamine-hydrolyzing) [Methanospirillum sp.]
MCGIAGIISKDAVNFENEMDKMLISLKHRGPDGSGVKKFSNCILGHTRLSIIDHDGGQQPMDSSESNKSIVFNGEIYGYKEIQENLANYKFLTNSDTEVILALYEKYGSDCLERLPGMFAFAIWDEAEGTLFAARDRFGEKPFYYAFGQNQEFIFASEIKAIIKTGLITPVLDINSLMHYLQYLYVPPNRTIFSNIHTLSPAHLLIYKDGTLQIQRYWSLPITNEIQDTNTAIQKFMNLLEDSVRKQLVADVSVGAFLSGGLDSSTIVALASKYKKNLKTFSFGFGDVINELPYAQEIADKYKTDHHVLRAEDYDIAQLLLEMADVFDEPFADSSNIPTYLISKLARKHLKVILTGDGADELLGGYDYWYQSALGFEGKGNKNTIVKQIIKRIKKKHETIPFLQRIIPLKFWNLIPLYLQYDNIILEQEEKRKYFSDIEINKLSKNNNFFSDLIFNRSYSFYQEHNVNDALKMDLINYMPGDILVKTDRASMAHGLELRSPFLDPEFAEFCISLPISLKITEKTSKVFLREAFGDMWTSSLRKRGKMGFGAPVHEWLQLESVKNLKYKYLHDEKMKIFSILSFEKVQEYIHKDNYKTWILLVLSIWMEKNIFLMPNHEVG